jgi:hypothetical protein
VARLADQFAVSALGNTLGRDQTFLAASRLVADGKADAWTLAGSYYPRGPGRKLVAHLLEVAADDHDPRPVVDRMIGLGSHAFWTETPLATGDARRWLRKDVLAKLRSGARLLARRGAGKCLGCGSRLRTARRRSSRGRWERRDYCDPCTTRIPEQVRHRPDQLAIKEVLDRALPLVLPGELNRTAARRTKRR